MNSPRRVILYPFDPVQATLWPRRARKQYECWKCRRPIKSGELYYYISKWGWSPFRLCRECGDRAKELKPSEVIAE